MFISLAEQSIEVLYSCKPARGNYICGVVVRMIFIRHARCRLVPDVNPPLIRTGISTTSDLTRAFGRRRRRRRWEE